MPPALECVARISSQYAATQATAAGSPKQDPAHQTPVISASGVWVKISVATNVSPPRTNNVAVVNLNLVTVVVTLGSSVIGFPRAFDRIVQNRRVICSASHTSKCISRSSEAARRKSTWGLPNDRCRPDAEVRVSSKQSFVLALADQRIDLAAPAADSCGWNMLDGVSRSVDLRRAESLRPRWGNAKQHEPRMTT